jgi:tRNA(Ile)-lysidine synthetase-like protein
MEILERVRATLRERQLLPPEGGTVIVGYSGGADSTALLHLLTRLQGAFNLRIHAAHLHHGMRPEADDDVRVCASVCAQLGVPLHVERVDVPALAQTERISLEEAGRNARYAFFERLARELNAVAVALAHTRDDQIETILINLLRGTGPRGLCGMPYKRDRIIRPLLDATRAQTHQYCAAQGLPTVFDSTNLDPHQLRRRVRMELIPLLRDLSPAFDRHLLRLADILENEESWWEYEVGRVMSHFVESPLTPTLSPLSKGGEGAGSVGIEHARIPDTLSLPAESSLRTRARGNVGANGCSPLRLSPTRGERVQRVWGLDTRVSPTPLAYLRNRASRTQARGNVGANGPPLRPSPTQ